MKLLETLTINQRTKAWRQNRDVYIYQPQYYFSSGIDREDMSLHLANNVDELQSHNIQDAVSIISEAIFTNGYYDSYPRQIELKTDSLIECKHIEDKNMGDKFGVFLDNKIVLAPWRKEYTQYRFEQFERLLNQLKKNKELNSQND